MDRGLGATAIARLCGWLERAELPAPPLDTLPGVQTFDVQPADLLHEPAAREPLKPTRHGADSQV